jgi:hypothetical protein
LRAANVPLGSTPDKTAESRATMRDSAVERRKGLVVPGVPDPQRVETRVVASGTRFDRTTKLVPCGAVDLIADEQVERFPERVDDLGKTRSRNRCSLGLTQYVFPFGTEFRARNDAEDPFDRLRRVDEIEIQLEPHPAHSSLQSVQQGHSGYVFSHPPLDNLMLTPRHSWLKDTLDGRRHVLSQSSVLEAEPTLSPPAHGAITSLGVNFCHLDEEHIVFVIAKLPLRISPASRPGVSELVDEAAQHR